MGESRFHPMQWVRALVRPIDPLLLAILLLFMAASYLIMLSASPERTDSLTGHMAIALGVVWVVARLKPLQLLQMAVPLYLLGVLLLVGVALFGETSKGAQRWLHLGVVRIQPSELMKIAMPLMLAWYFQQREHLTGVRDFLVAAVLLAVPVALIVTQPDLGTSLLVAAAGLYVIYFAGLSWKLILPVLLLAAGGIIAIVVFGDTLCEPGVDWFGMREYQRQRVCTLLDPTRDPLGKGFHIIQSTIAIGSGGLFGKGWMEGTQTHLSFIPERHTDFIFAVIAEEFGFVGAMLLLVANLLLIWRGLYIAMNASLHGSRLLAGAITMIFFTYVFVNLGMVSGILPVVGVPLPLISYGGTAMVTLCLGIGILMSIHRHRSIRAE